MKKTAIFICCLFCFKICVPAQTLFNKNYDKNHLWESVHALGYCDDGYLLGAKTIGFTYDDNQLWLIKINEQGDTLWTKKYCNNNGTPCYWAQPSIERIGSDYYFAGVIENPLANESKAFLYKINEWGDSLWMKTYGTNGVKAFNTFKRTQDGGFILAGYANTTDPAGDFYIVKTDTSGNVLWENSLGGNGWQAAYSVDETPDGGYLLAGKGGDFMAAQIVVIKTDGQGQLLWHRIVGGYTHNDGRHQAKVLSDGNYLVSGSKGVNPGVYTHDSDAYIAKMSTTGSILWEKVFSSNNDSDFGSNILELPSGEIICSGIKYVQLPGSSSSFIQAMIMKLTPDGNEIWERLYHGRPESNAYFYGIAEANDGGLMAFGLASAYDVSLPQDAWLVKMDSEGLACDSIGCIVEIVNSIDNTPNDKIQLVCAPNPAQNNAQAIIHNYLYADSSALFEVYNVCGNRMFQCAITANNHGETTIDLPSSDWAPGLYIATLTAEGQVLGCIKIVIL